MITKRLCNVHILFFVLLFFIFISLTCIKFQDQDCALLLTCFKRDDLHDKYVPTYVSTNAISLPRKIIHAAKIFAVLGLHANLANTPFAYIAVPRGIKYRAYVIVHCLHFGIITRGITNISNIITWIIYLYKIIDMHIT